EALVEPDETFNVNLSVPVNAVLGTATATGTILDDDGPPNPRLAIGDVAVVEGDTNSAKATFTVTLDQPKTTDVTAQWATAPGTATAGSDYTTASGTVTIPAGKTSASIGVTVLGNTTVEPDEMFTVTLSSPVGATIVRPTGTGRILDDDPPGIVIGVGDASVVEGNLANRTATLLVTLSQPSASAITVHWATSPGTATSSDFVGASKDLVILAGATS